MKMEMKLPCTTKLMCTIAIAPPTDAAPLARTPYSAPLGARDRRLNGRGLLLSARDRRLNGRGLLLGFGDR